MPRASSLARGSSEHSKVGWLIDDSQTALETAAAAVPQVRR
jgi:hypothetical protein